MADPHPALHVTFAPLPLSLSLGFLWGGSLYRSHVSLGLASRQFTSWFKLSLAAIASLATGVRTVKSRDGLIVVQD